MIQLKLLEEQMQLYGHSKIGFHGKLLAELKLSKTKIDKQFTLLNVLFTML